MTTWVCLSNGSRADLARSNWPLMPRWITSRLPSSSLSSRYLPLRLTAVILRPSSLVMKFFLVLWRRIVRRPVASTVLIRLPTTSLSRSRRMVSTSGNSGIDAPQLAQLGGELLPRLAGGDLLGLLLRPALPLAARLGTQVHRGCDGPHFVVTL